MVKKMLAAILLPMAVTAAEIDVTAYGAKPDGATDSTEAIQRAIDACAAQGGGRVTVPAGGTYVSRRLSLRSNVELHLEDGATVKCSDEIEKFPEFEPTEAWRWDRPVRWNRYSFFYTCGQTNVAVTGKGTLDGNSVSERFHRRVNGKYIRTSDTNIVARGLFFAGCRDVRVEGILYKDACGWTTWFLDCDRVNVRGMRIRCNPERPNGDGLHFGGCRDVRVEGCDIEANDDAIILRAHQEQMRAPRPCERVTVENCRLWSNQFAVRVGWSGDAPVRDCHFRNIDCPYSFRGIGFTEPTMYDPAYTRDPPRGNGIPLPDFPTVPFGVEDVTFEDMRLTSRTVPFCVTIGGWERCEGLKGVAFRRCRFFSQMAPVFVCRPEDNLREWTLEDVEFTILKPRGALSPNCGTFFDNGRDIRIERMKWTCVPNDSPEWNIVVRQRKNGEWEQYVDPKTRYVNLRRATNPKPPQPVRIEGATLRPRVETPKAGVKRYVYEKLHFASSVIDMRVVVEERAEGGGTNVTVRVENHEKDMDVVGFEGPYAETGSFRPGYEKLRVGEVEVTKFPTSGRGLALATDKASAGWYSCGDRPETRRRAADVRVAEDRTRATYVAAYGKGQDIEVESGGTRRVYRTAFDGASRPRFRYDNEFGTADVGFEFGLTAGPGETREFTAYQVLRK